jgi:peroxiredoxin
MNKLVLPIPDSVIKEGDALLAKARGTKEVFKYTLWWLTHNAESSKIMGMDVVFVHLVENYYMKGDATWLSREELNKYFERASKIAPNLIGNVAPEIVMEDLNKVKYSLSGVKAKYTLLIFWDPTCGHCTKEIPAVDSVLKSALKNKDIKVFAVKTEGPENKWTEFIEKNSLKKWLHVYDPERKSNYRSTYDVYSTPVIYVLDEKKIIKAKRIDHTNLVSVFEMLEAKEKDKK